LAISDVFNLISLIRLLSGGLACSTGLNIHDLNGTIKEFGGTGAFKDITGNDILAGGVGIESGC
jgi:hypothetical protein